MTTTRKRVLVTAFVIALLAVPAAAGAAGGFAGPVFGLTTAPNGDVLAADAGTGLALADGTVDIALPFMTDASPIGRTSLWATTTGYDPEDNTGQALYRISDDGVRMIANLFEFEDNNDPDGAGVDSNPFDVQSLGGRAALVVDAGGNDLLRVDNRGHIELLAVFPDELVSTANITGLVETSGCPFGPGGCPALPLSIPAQAVPTSVAVGPDGWYYVGELKGFPAPTGESNIWKVAPDAAGEACPSDKCVKVFDGGFTSIIDLAFGPDGKLYVAELDEDSWAAVEIFEAGSGGTINACELGGSCTEVMAGIPMLTAITFGKDGSLWATRNALIPPIAEVFEVP